MFFNLYCIFINIFFLVFHQNFILIFNNYKKSLIYLAFKILSILNKKKILDIKIIIFLIFPIKYYSIKFFIYLK
jgi:hypothetical protein